MADRLIDPDEGLIACDFEDRGGTCTLQTVRPGKAQCGYGSWCPSDLRDSLTAATHLLDEPGPWPAAVVEFRHRHQLCPDRPAPGPERAVGHDRDCWAAENWGQIVAGVITEHHACTCPCQAGEQGSGGR